MQEIKNTNTEDKEFFFFSTLVHILCFLLLLECFLLQKFVGSFIFFQPSYF